AGTGVTRDKQGSIPGSFFTFTDAPGRPPIIGASANAQGTGMVWPGPAAQSTSVDSVIAGEVTTTTPHGLHVGDMFFFDLLRGADPARLISNTPYYVIEVSIHTNFTFYDTHGGAPSLLDNATAGPNHLHTVNPRNL